jgi:hypothetical protein
MELPNEIIREICESPELERKDLRALRLTNKYLCELVLPRFAKESFSRVTVLMARPSLRAFIELSQHPYFGPVVKEINISPMSATCDGLAGFPGLEAPESTDTGQLGYSLKTVERVTTYLTRYRMETKLRTDGSAERMLGVAFKAFAQRHQSFQLQFGQNESNAIGAIDLMHHLSLGETKAWRLDWKMTVQRTMRAITGQGCNVTALSIDDYAAGDCVYDSGLCTNEIKQQLSSLCLQLERLEIWFFHTDTESTLTSVKRMVSAATNLRSLHLMKLSPDGSSTSQEVPDVLEYVASTSLETIVIAEFQAFDGELYDFFSTQRDTLRDLRLLGGCLIIGSCMSLIGWIKDNLPNLVDLELRDICGSNNHADCREEDFKSYHIRCGENMQLCLARILEGNYEKDGKVEEIDEMEQAKVNTNGNEQAEVVDG